MDEVLALPKRESRAEQGRNGGGGAERNDALGAQEQQQAAERARSTSLFWR